MKKYIPIESTEEENMLCLTTGFDAGGTNWWNGQQTLKGYYLYCTPVLEKENALSDGTAYKTYGTYEFKVPEKWKADFDKIIDGDMRAVSDEYVEMLEAFYPKLADEGLFRKLFRGGVEEKENA